MEQKVYWNVFFLIFFFFNIKEYWDKLLKIPVMEAQNLEVLE